MRMAAGFLPTIIFRASPSHTWKRGVHCSSVHPKAASTLSNFMRTHLFSALGTLKIGLDILFEQEQVKIDRVLGHGGFFKTEEVGQKMMAAAMNVPVSVMETAGEGGAWGIALLASYMLHKEEKEPLEAYLSNKVFAGENGTTIAPDQRDVAWLYGLHGTLQRGTSHRKSRRGCAEIEVLCQENEEVIQVPVTGLFPEELRRLGALVGRQKTCSSGPGSFSRFCCKGGEYHPKIYDICTGTLSHGIQTTWEFRTSGVRAEFRHRNIWRG